MSDDTTESLLPFAGAGSVALVGGVVGCLGLKLIGGAVLFSGVATAVGLSTGLVTFLVGGVGGLSIAVLLLGARQVDALREPR